MTLEMVILFLEHGIANMSRLFLLRTPAMPAELRGPVSIPNGKVIPNGNVIPNVSRAVAGVRWTLLFGWLAMLVASPIAAQQRGPEVVSVEAIPGEPFGVGRVTFKLGPDDAMVARTGALRLTERDGRILYPAISSGFLGRMMTNIGGGSNSQLNVHFLFRGDAPLAAQLRGAWDTDVEIIPQTPRRQRGENLLWRSWWREYNAAFTENNDYPPSFEVYLISMLANRLAMEPSVRASRQQRPDAMQQTVELLFNVEEVRARAIGDLMTTGIERQQATQPLPPPVGWQRSRVLPPDERPDLENLAQVVPEECFYVRFGSWQNQIWLKNLLDEYGGDIGRMVQWRGHSYPGQEKLMAQLALESSGMDDLLGGTLISDVALIGTDLYANDGSAAGVLFESRNALFKTNLAARRRSAARGSDGVLTLETLELSAGEASFLHRPDNRVRSFLVSHDNIHLITNSRYLAERFLQAAQGERRLSDHPEFQHARRILPLDREDTLFVYFSSEFFQNLMSPQYQIELRRRSQLTAEVQMLQLATHVAQREGLPAAQIGDLVQSGLLPQNFGYRLDGSELRFVDGSFVDSLRGARGYFLPIPDVPIERVSLNESDWYAERAEFYGGSLKRVDPLFGAIKRYELESDVERLVFDARVAPFAKENYRWLTDNLGPPIEFEMTPGTGDVLRLQASLSLLAREPYQVFAAIQNDSVTPVGLGPANIFELLQILKSTPGYVGAWPKPGVLDFLPRLGGEPDDDGFTYSRLLDLWRLQAGEFSLLAFEKQRLEQARPSLEIVPAERAAQLRLDVSDLSQARLSGWVNNVNYRVSWQNSVSNVQLLNILIDQFGVPTARARELAEDVLGLKLVCNLGGPYAIRTLPSGRQVWVSASWPEFDATQLPEDYVAPLLLWFRGLHLEATEANDQFLVYGWVDIQRQEQEKSAGLQLPGFDLFKGFERADKIPRKDSSRSRNSGDDNGADDDQTDDDKTNESGQPD